jgi:hypothetical protein
MNVEVLSYAASEAISSLGLLKPSANGTLVRLLQLSLVTHPRALATAYRKEGAQVAKEEKRALGLRSNAFLSEYALSEMTDLGMARAQEAHELTLLRAHFTRLRLLSLSRETVEHADYFEYSTVSSQCAGCLRIKGRRYSIRELTPNQPHDCEREACPVMIRSKIDFLGRAAAKYHASISE